MCATTPFESVLLFFRNQPVFLNYKRYRIMLQDSFSDQPDPPLSLLYFILFTGYLLSRGSNTSCPCFAIRSFLIMLPSTFQNFTLLPGRSALLQTPELSEYHPVVSEFSYQAQLSGTSFSFCPSFYPSVLSDLP